MQLTCILSPLLLLFCLAAAHAQQPISKFTFLKSLNNDGTGKGACHINQNINLQEDAISIHGNYGEYEIFCGTPEIGLREFSLVIRFKSDHFSQHQNVIVMAGKMGRWFGLTRSGKGALTINFNNNEFSRELPGTLLNALQWHSIACAVDIPSHRVVAYIDGKDAGTIELPSGFKIREPIVDESEPRHPYYGDKHFLFADCSNGSIFNGLVDEIVVFNRTLSAAEMKEFTTRP